MQDVVISQITSKRDMYDFVRFNYELYKDNPYAVPDILEDTLETFDSKKNPAFAFCEAAFFLAKREGKIVGRVAAIINKRANETWNEKDVRFGWIDFIDDLEVTRSLMDAVEKWGRERGMNRMVGPLGFTDMDLEGMLVDGFDQLGTMCTIYNYPYYPVHMEKLGLIKDTGWVERKVIVPKPGHEANMAKFFKIAELVRNRYGFKTHRFTSKRELKRSGYVEKVLDVVNRSYAKLYGFSQLDDKQIQYYASKFLFLLNLRYLSIVENAQGDVIGFGVCITSLSRAIQKAKGKLFPFGWIYFAKALWFDRHPQVLDMLLVGVLPEYQEKGANALIFADLIPEGSKDGYDWAETHLQLDDNLASQMQWKNLECEIHKRRTAYAKSI